MADPAISTVTAGFDYQIANSKAMLIGFSLDLTGLSPVVITVSLPNAAVATVTARLVRKSPSAFQDLLWPQNYPAGMPFANRTVSTSKTVVGPITELSITVNAPSLPSTGEAWILLIQNTTAINWEVSVNAGTLPIVRILCDPAVGTGWTSVPASTSPVPEHTSVALTRALDPTTGTVVGTPPGTITFAWAYTGTIAIPALNGSSPSPSRVFTTPGVYGDTTIDISVQPSFADSDLPAPYTLTNSSAPQPLQIEVRPQYLAIVLDRSGSMAIDNRWDNAKTAGRMLVNLFGALRQGVSSDDRIGVLVFEDSHCSWHGIPIDPLIAPIPTLDVEDPATANSNVCGAPFGNYGTCTPIGDALYVAMGRLSSLPNPVSGRIPRYTIIVLTDGYENSGTIQVGPGPLAPGALETFSAARLFYGTVNNSMSLYTIGLGHFTDDAVLAALPEPANAGSLGGVYNHIYDVKDLAPSLLEMLVDSQEAQIPAPLATLVPPDDPEMPPPSNPMYFDVEPQANRIAIAVTATTWTGGGVDAIEVAYRTAKNGSNGYTGPFTVLSGATSDCATHGFYTHELVTLLGGGNQNNVPGSQWRVRHMKSGVAQAITSDNMFSWIDLYVKAEVTFDQPAYGTGDTMLVTCAISAGNQPVTGAKITVELARPGESLGTFLSVNSKGYQPGRQESADPLAPKPAMLSTLLQQKKMAGLPIIKPPTIFDDGSNQLFDDGSHHDWAGDDGVYANTYSGTDKEGSYMWRFNVQGRLPDGSPFSRLITLATFVGINVSPTVSATQVLFGQPAPAGFQAAQVAIVPKDLKGEYLGPFRPDQVVFTTTAGTFREPYTQFRYDGTYYRTVVYKQGQLPVVTVEVQGKCGQPIIIARGCLGWLGGLIGRIYLWFVNRAARSG